MTPYQFIKAIKDKRQDIQVKGGSSWKDLNLNQFKDSRLNYIFRYNDMQELRIKPKQVIKLEQELKQLNTVME